MKPIRILHMIGSMEIGGSQTMVLNLYRAIDREQIQFDFIVDEPTRCALKAQFESLGARIYTLPKLRGANLLEIRRAWDHFFAEHPEYKILHSHVRSYASVYLPIAKKHGLTTIIHSHSTANGTGITALVKAILQYPLRYQADYLFSCSDLAGAWLFGKRATKKNNYRMIPNGIDCRKFAFSETERSRVRQAWEIPEDAFVVGHIGRFQEAKNHAFLIEIFAKLAKHRDDARLLLVGDGDLRPETERLCAQRGICDKVIFTGFQTDPAQFYQAMDLFLFPSKWEGLPVSIVEAQACGLPCLVSDVITKDVKLTELVAYYSLTEPAESWAGQILRYADRSRTGLLEAQSQSLMRFDSNYTAVELQKFYLELHELAVRSGGKMA